MHALLEINIKIPGLCVLNLLYDIHAFKDFSENDMSAVQPRCRYRGDEELGAIGVLSSICHWQDTLIENNVSNRLYDNCRLSYGSCVTQLEVFILESATYARNIFNNNDTFY